MPRISIRDISVPSKAASYAAAGRARRALGYSKRRGAMKPRVYSRPSGVEFKAVDTTINSESNSTGEVTLLNGLARGDDVDARVGRKVVMKSVQLQLRPRVTVTTGLAQICRIMLVYDKQTNAAALTIAQVLQNASISGLRNLENRDRFVVLMDQFIELSASGNQGDFKHFNKYLRCNLPVIFNSGDAGTIADITTGSLYLITVGSEAAGDTDANVFGYSRVRFEDA